MINIQVFPIQELDGFCRLQAHPRPFRRARVPRVGRTAGSRGAPGLRQIGGLGGLLVDDGNVWAFFMRILRGLMVI